MVQGVTTDWAVADAARARLAKEGQAGMASVALVSDYTALPYNDHLANVVVAALDAPGAAAIAEVMRVVQPLGVAYLRRKGVWAKEVKPMPNEMDEWTHYEHGPDGNPLTSLPTATIRSPRPPVYPREL